MFGEEFAKITEKMTKSSELPPIMGLPPEEEFSNLRHYAMPVVEITPCVPDFTRGSSLFRAKNAFKDNIGKTPSYSSLLEQHGFTTTENCLKYAFLADSFPTDNFANEYGDSILEKLTGTVSSTAADLSQMFGARNAEDAVKNMNIASKKMGGVGGSAAGIVSGGMQMGIDAIKGIGGAVGNMTGTSGIAASIGSTLSNILAGGRIDFPSLWKGSSFKPSYSLTIRLFNPNPGDLDATHKYIVGPVASLLLLAIPISDDGFTYNWPYIHKIRCRGIYNINAAFISNVTVIKGGDQHQIGYNQRLGIVDVRLDFGSLFNSMVAMNYSLNEDRPTLRSYLDELTEEKPDIDAAISFEKYKQKGESVALNADTVWVDRTTTEQKITATYLTAKSTALNAIKSIL